MWDVSSGSGPDHGDQLSRVGSVTSSHERDRLRPTAADELKKDSSIVKVEPCEPERLGYLAGLIEFDRIVAQPFGDGYQAAL